MGRKFTELLCGIVLSAMILQPSVFGAGAANFAQHYEAAQNFYNQGQYSSAILEFRKSLRINYLDNSARIGIVNSYLARASYYANQEKNYEKAANDFRSALFYLKMYPDKEQAVQNSSAMIASANENLNQCLKVLGFDRTASSRFKKAEELRAMSNFSAAAYEFSKAASNESLSGDANIQIADLMKLLGNEPRSVEYYKNALEMKSSDGLLRMKYARTLDRLGKYDEAVVQYNAALANSKGDMEVLYALERIYLKKLAQTPSDAELYANIGAIKQAQGDFDSALSYYGKAEQINPDNINTRLNVGTLFQQKKDFVKAIKAYDSVLTLYPDNVQANLYKAQALSETGDKKNALVLYKKVLTLEPSNQAAKTEIVEVMKSTMSPSEFIAYLSQNGNWDKTTLDILYDYSYKLHKENKVKEAIEGYKAVISKNPSTADAYVNLAICYASTGDYHSAQSILNTAKNKFPSDNLVLKTLKDVQNDSITAIMEEASSSYESKDYKTALNKYLSVNPATEDSLLGAAASYQAMQNYGKAIEYYKKAGQINPKNAEIPYYIGYLYYEQKNWTEAQTYLNKAISLNPQSEAKNLISYVEQNLSANEINDAVALFEKGNFESALTKFNEILKKEPKNAYAYYYRALIYDEQKKTNLAITDYLNVLKNSKDMPIANYMLAVDYDGQENYKAAFKYYNQFVADYSNEDEYLNYAKNRLEELRPYVEKS